MHGQARTLAIDTSLACGGVAALAGDRVAERRFTAAPEHARRIASFLGEAAGELGWTPRDVELVAVVRGPGSFTGLRVGIATAKAIAWAAGARLVAISTFEVIAWQMAQARAQDNSPMATIFIALDAGRGEVFAAEARPAAGSPTGWEIGPASILPAAAWLATLPAGACVSGPALDVVPIETRPDLVTAAAAMRHPTATATACLARFRARAGERHDPLMLVPEYLRPSYADEKAQFGTAVKSARGAG
jgi:tRNA threonylcarbamoyladenosine biosynthesis protein TsaB